MKRTLIVLAILVACMPSTSTADGFGVRGWGPRAGVSMDPDQLLFGAHLDLSDSRGKARLQPNVEMGLGDNLISLGFNLDVAYRFASRWDAWTPYLGGGMGLRMLSDDNQGLRDETRTDAGLSALAGVDRGLASGSRFFMEAKLGFVDAPDLRFLLGWTFGR